MTQSNSGSSFPAWLAYLAGFITGLIGLSVEKDDQSVRFHCAQAIGFSIFLVVLSIVLAIVGMILGLIPLLGAILMGLINLIV